MKREPQTMTIMESYCRVTHHDRVLALSSVDKLFVIPSSYYYCCNNNVILVVSLPVQLIKILLRKYKAYIYAMLAMSLLICLNFLKNLSECLNERTSVILPR